MPILTVESAENLLKALEDFLDKSDASFALIIERGQGAIENFENIKFLFLGDDRQRKKKQRNERGETSARHELEPLFAEAAFRDQIDGKAAEPMPALVMRASHGGESRATMSFSRGKQRRPARIIARQCRDNSFQHPGAA